MTETKVGPLSTSSDQHPFSPYNFTTCIIIVAVICFYSVVVNILQKDMFPQDVDTEIRRGCYAICLQLAR